MSSDIPAARGLLRDVATALEDGTIPTRTAAIRIRAALAHMTRASPARRAPRQSQPMTAKLAAEVRSRVSEAVNGKR